MFLFRKKYSLLTNRDENSFFVLPSKLEDLASLACSFLLGFFSQISEIKSSKVCLFCDGGFISLILSVFVSNVKFFVEVFLWVQRFQFSGFFFSTKL